MAITIAHPGSKAPPPPRMNVVAAAGTMTVVGLMIAVDLLMTLQLTTAEAMTEVAVGHRTDDEQQQQEEEAPQGMTASTGTRTVLTTIVPVLLRPLPGAIGNVGVMMTGSREAPMGCQTELHLRYGASRRGGALAYSTRSGFCLWTECRKGRRGRTSKTTFARSMGLARWGSQKSEEMAPVPLAWCICRPKPFSATRCAKCKVRRCTTGTARLH